MYLAHDRLGAELLQRAGSNELTTTWAREHHLSPARWTVDNTGSSRPQGSGRGLVSPGLAVDGLDRLCCLELGRRDARWRCDRLNPRRRARR